MAHIHPASRISTEALRTLARITFTMGAAGAAFGCVEDPEGRDEAEGDATTDVDAASDDDGAFADLGLVEVPDGALPDAVLVFTDDAGDLADGDFLADAWVDEDAEPEGDAGADDDAAEGDATTTERPCEPLLQAQDWEAHAKCCEDIGFDWELDPSCTPWGPPVPPAMPASASDKGVA